MTVPTPKNLTGTPGTNSILWSWEAGEADVVYKVKYGYMHVDESSGRQFKIGIYDSDGDPMTGHLSGAADAAVDSLVRVEFTDGPVLTPGTTIYLVFVRSGYINRIITADTWKQRRKEGNWPDGPADLSDSTTENMGYVRMWVANADEVFLAGDNRDSTAFTASSGGGSATLCEWVMDGYIVIDLDD